MEDEIDLSDILCCYQSL